MKLELAYSLERFPLIGGPIWHRSTLIVSTPQVISNDLISGKIDFNNVGLIIFDEAHRAVGDYAYVFIGERFRSQNGLALGITASPGSKADKIAEVCRNIGASNVALRTEYDSDVIDYTHRISMIPIEVEMTENANKIAGILRSMLDEKKKEIQRHGLSLSPKRLSIKELLATQAVIRARLHSGERQSSLYHAASLIAAAMKLNQALEYVETQSMAALRNYLERLEMQARGKGASRATRMLVADERIRGVMRLAAEVQVEHPKVAKVIELVRKELLTKPQSRIIIFTQYREVSEMVCNELLGIPGSKPVRFIGQATKGEDRGMKQKEQVETLQKFRDGEFNILVATSVAEEGLDIPSTDVVIFYEPVPSDIRSIQRRGRTGRIRAGKAYILVTKGTRDVPYFWSSISKEKRMKKLIALKNELMEKVGYGEVGGKERAGAIEGRAPEIVPVKEASHPEAKSEEGERAVRRKSQSSTRPQPSATPAQSPVLTRTAQPESREAQDVRPEPKVIVQTGTEVEKVTYIVKEEVNEPAGGDDAGRKGQLSLADFEGDKEKRSRIVVDAREFNSEVVRELSRMGLLVEQQRLEVGDYVLSDRVCVERKEAGDFLESLMDGRLFSQLRDLKNSYLRPLLVIEGEGLFTRRQLSEEAIYGGLASIITDFGVPIMFTKDGRETAKVLSAILKREIGEKRVIGIRGEKRSMSLQERQQFIVEGLPKVSGVLAQRLLSQFGSIKAIVEADVEELCKVRGIGKGIAEEIMKTLREKYYGKKEEEGEKGREDKTGRRGQKEGATKEEANGAREDG